MFTINDRVKTIFGCGTVIAFEVIGKRTTYIVTVMETNKTPYRYIVKLDDPDKWSIKDCDPAFFKEQLELI